MKIELKNNAIYIGDKPVFIRSGEIHYFRIPFEEWEERIVRAKEAGLNCISSYIPWIWHEPDEGIFDFTGETLKERNLLHFIELVKKQGLYFIARIGPYFNAELIFDGLPRWLVKKQNIRKVSEKIPHFISYSDPVFLEYVKKWYEQLIKHIADLQITRNGNIILVQLCNEIEMLNWLEKQPDKISSEMFSPEDLMAVPENMEKLTGFEKLHSLYFSEYFKTLKKFAVDFGIDVPFVANVAQFEDYHDRGRAFDAILTAVKFENFASPDTLLAGDFYPKRIDYDNFHDTVIAIEILKAFSHPGNPTLCMELQAGFIYDRPKIYPSDVELLTSTCIGHGLAGVNFYMFAGGTNFEGVGVYGKWHDWQSPISWDGNLKQSFYAIKDVLKSLNIFEPDGFEKVYDAYVGIYKPYFSTMFLKGEFADEIEKVRDQFFHDGLLRLLSIANVNFKFIDVEKNDIQDLDHLLLFAYDWMDEKTQRKLVDFAREKTLVIFYDLPVKNLKAQDTDIFSKVLKIKKIEKFNPGGYDPDNYYKFVAVFGEHIPIFSRINTVELDGDLTAIATYRGKNAGFVKKIDDGKIIFLGFGINHRYDYQIEILYKIIEMSGIEPRILCEPRDIHASLLRNGNKYYLFVANYHEEHREVKVDVKIDRNETRHIRLSLEPRKSKIIEL